MIFLSPYMLYTNIISTCCLNVQVSKYFLIFHDEASSNYFKNAHLLVNTFFYIHQFPSYRIPVLHTGLTDGKSIYLGVVYFFNFPHN